MKRIGPIGLLVVLGLAAAPGVHADTLHVSADTCVSRDNPEQSRGTQPSVIVQGSGADLHGYVRFDLTPLTSSVTGTAVSRALLRMWSGPAAHPGSVDVHPVLEAWSERTLTWSSAPALGPALASLTVGDDDALQYVTVDVTSLVQAWLDGTLPNQGLALLPGTERVRLELDSKENQLTSHPMELDVVLKANSAGGDAGTNRAAADPSAPDIPEMPPAAWTVAGNAGTTAGISFLGTTDAVSLQLRVNGVAALRLEPIPWAPSATPNLVGGYSGNGVSFYTSGAVIGGGGALSLENRVIDSWGTVGGGFGNSAGWASSVGGGYDNQAPGNASTVPGGRGNRVFGDLSFAAGYQARADHDGTFIWADSSVQSPFTSTGHNQFLIRAEGGVGINTSSPVAGGGLTVNGEIFSGHITVYGDVTATGNSNIAGNATITGNLVSGNATVTGNSTVSGNATVTGNQSFGFATRQMLNLWGTAYGIGVQNYGTYFRSDADFSWFKGGTHNDGIANPGGGVRQMRLDAGGNLMVLGTVAVGGADFAEMLPARDGVEAGDVLAIGADGRLARSTEPYQDTLAGIYSTKPGLLGGAADGEELTGKIPLAVTGVVPVKVTAENGPIAPGDSLTSSSTPGRAMKATKVRIGGVAFFPSGVILGKALEPLDAGEGLIQALVVLQ